MIPLDEANKIAADYAPLLSAANGLWALLATILTAAAVFWKKIWGLIWPYIREKEKASLTSEEREIFYQVYSKISQAQGLVLRDGRVAEEAQRLYWEARDKARLELPEDIAHYAETLRSAANKAYSINESYLYPKNLPGLPVGEKRSKKVDEHEEHVSVLIDAKPYEIFAAYMRIKAQ